MACPRRCSGALAIMAMKRTPTLVTKNDTPNAKNRIKEAKVGVSAATIINQKLINIPQNNIRVEYSA